MKAKISPHLARLVLLAIFIAIAAFVFFNPASNQVKVAEGAPQAPSANWQVFLPFAKHSPCTTSKGIFGRVTFKGASAGGVSLMLRFYNGSTWSTYATTTTNSSGNYAFAGLPALGSGQIYYVRFQNSLSGSNTRLWYWGTQYLYSYFAGCDAAIGDFDIANVPQVSPLAGATVALPYTFQWTRRTATPTDSYTLELFDPYGTAYATTYYLGYVGSVTVNSLPTGFSPGVLYGWYPGVYSPDGGYGYAYYYYPVTFSNSGTVTLHSPVVRTARDRVEGAIPNPAR
ncbi:MAG: hypothetical protein M1482_15635 [Chloroflexi bacterium]|nr:hypothetical protein [Chloroflexota bacterium]